MREHFSVTNDDGMANVADFFFRHCLEDNLGSDSGRVAHGDTDARLRLSCRVK
jgi:hypothetical protein